MAEEEEVELSKFIIRSIRSSYTDYKILKVHRDDNRYGKLFALKPESTTNRSGLMQAIKEDGGCIAYRTDTYRAYNQGKDMVHLNRTTIHSNFMSMARGCIHYDNLPEICIRHDRIDVQMFSHEDSVPMSDPDCFDKVRGLYLIRTRLIVNQAINKNKGL